MIDLVIASLAAYALTFVVTSAAVLDHPRFWVMKRTPYLMARGKHMLECRMCSGLWISLAIGLYYDVQFLPVYGLSYFLATQER